MGQGIKERLWKLPRRILLRLTVSCLRQFGLNAVDARFDNNKTFTTISSSFKVSALQNSVWKLEFSKAVLSMGYKTLYWRDKYKRFKCALSFWTYFNKEDEMMSQIITGDKTWVFRITLIKTKNRWNGVRCSLLHRLKPSNKHCHAARSWQPVFWDWYVVLQMDLMPQLKDRP